MGENGGRPDAGEITRDALGRHVFYQPRAGYRFSIDSVLLAAFATPTAGPVADLCAGCGVVGLLLAARGLAGPFLAVEIDPLAAHCCQLNQAHAGLDGQTIRADLSQDHPALQPGGYKLVVCNPPFSQAGRGRASPDPARARARTELALQPHDLWRQAARLLKRGDRLAFCWPASRLPQALAELGQHRLTPKRLRLIHGRLDAPAKTALIEAVKDGGQQLSVHPPLIVHGPDQEYTPEVSAIYRDLGLF